MGVSTGSFRDYRQRRRVVGRREERRKGIEELMSQKVTGEGLCCEKIPPAECYRWRIHGLRVITRLLQFNQINHFFWESANWKQSLLIHAISQVTLIVANLPWETCEMTEERNRGEEEEDIHRQKTVKCAFMMPSSVTPEFPVVSKISNACRV